MNTYHLEKDSEGFLLPIPTFTPFKGENVILGSRALDYGPTEYGYKQIMIEGYRVGDKVYAFKLSAPRTILNAPVLGRKERYPNARPKLLIGIGSDRPEEDYPYDHTPEVKWFHQFHNDYNMWLAEYMSGGRVVETEVKTSSGDTQRATIFEKTNDGRQHLLDYFPEWATGTHKWTPEKTFEKMTPTISKREGTYINRSTKMQENCTFYSMTVMEGRPFHLYIDAETERRFRENGMEDQLPKNFLELRSNPEKGITFLDMEQRMPRIIFKRDKPFKTAVEADAIQYAFEERNTDNGEEGGSNTSMMPIKKRCNPFTNDNEGERNGKMAKTTA